MIKYLKDEKEKRNETNIKKKKKIKERKGNEMK